MNKLFNFKTTFVGSSLAGLLMGLTAPAIAQMPVPRTGLSEMAAAKTPGFDKAMMLAAVRAGTRIVAVGDHGIVLLSDDSGKTFRQATKVPTRATLTSVTFVNEHEGWIAGHWGVILHTTDGGDTWTLQRDELDVDKPLFSILFKDAKTGFASGLWSLLLRTDDGGKTWQKIELPASEGRKQADKNLFSIFNGPHGDLFIAAEHGSVFHSADGGTSWTETSTGNAGTFWTGLSLRSDVILVAGLRGKIYRSADDGKTWNAIATPTKSSITSMTELPDGSVLAVGLDGITLLSRNGGESFELSTRPDQLANTAVVASATGVPVIFTALGVDHGAWAAKK